MAPEPKRRISSRRTKTSSWPGPIDTNVPDELRSTSRALPRNSQCFDSYTCFPEGFVCKAGMDELADKAKRMARGYEDLRQCLSRVSSMDDVESCVRQDNLKRF